MMFSSLRSRLWLSYALLIGVVICIVGTGVVLALQQSPLLYRQVVLRLRITEALLAPRLETVLTSSPSNFEEAVANEAVKSQLRVVVYQPDGRLIYDSGAGINSKLSGKTLAGLQVETDQTRASIFRDTKRVAWFYIVRPLSGGQYMLALMAKRPRLVLLTLFRDEIISPFLRAGVIALCLAFLVAFLMAEWISSPLRDMTRATQNISHGDYRVMPEKGPAEVRQLAKSFNMMLKRVQESQQSQREFIANVSHELKTPLTSVQGFAQAILDGAARTPEALHQAASVIYNESERMTRLVMDLLTLARLEGGTAGLQRAPVELSQVLGGIVEKFSIQARRSNVNLNINLNPLPVCMGDGDRLAQVFTNLVDNALKFTPGGGTVSVSAEGGEESVLVKIADTGNGIALEDQNRIFGRFYQVDKSRQGSEKRGVGLGLPIAKQIVLAHHGEIWVESNPGKGCTFLVRVPVSLPSDSTFNGSRRIK